jgi:hypothetical protein
MEFLEEIKKIVKWYEGISKGYNNLEILMEARRKLNSKSYYLAEIVGEMKYNYDIAYGERKIAIATTKAELMDSGESAAKSETRAVKENVEVIRKEKELEGTYYRLRLLLSQANELSSTLHQHISNLKIEKSGDN